MIFLLLFPDPAAIQPSHLRRAGRREEEEGDPSSGKSGCFPAVAVTLQAGAITGRKAPLWATWPPGAGGGEQGQGPNLCKIQMPAGVVRCCGQCQRAGKPVLGREVKKISVGREKQAGQI